MVRTVAEFDRDELREALRKAGEKTLCEERARTRRHGKNAPPALETASEEQDPQVASTEGTSGTDTTELSTSSDPDDLKCERVQ